MFSKVFPHELDEKGLDLFYKAIKTDDHAGPIDRVISDIYDNRLEIFLWENGDNSFLLVTEVAESRDGFRELFIIMCSGYGMFKEQSKIEALKVYARERGCSLITGYIKPEIASGNFNLMGKIKNKKEREDDGLGLNVFDITYVVVSTRV